ncbi:MAG: hemerythrin domain-containing protein [Desertimonas sp.]
MCDYCGCRTAGPTAELAREHELLRSLGDEIYDLLRDGIDPGDRFITFMRLLEMHAEKEEIGLFPHARANPALAPSIEDLCHEHEDLRAWLAHGPFGTRVMDALRLLVTHIDDEEYDLFPHVIHALDPEQWDEIELAQRAVEAVWATT